MKSEKFSVRFDELAAEAQSLLSSKYYRPSQYDNGLFVDPNLLISWKVKVKNLLEKSCGKNSEHYKEFVKIESSLHISNYDLFMAMKAVFDAAAEDFKGGYCNSVKNIVQAEVFSNELDQALELLDAGYLAAAAVIAGVVLETHLRSLCVDSQIPTGKLDRMNADLAKNGKYNLLVQKRITALAHIRNDAAHGKYENFKRNDVADMIAYIEFFIGEKL